MQSVPPQSSASEIDPIARPRRVSRARQRHLARQAKRQRTRSARSRMDISGFSMPVGWQRIVRDFSWRSLGGGQIVLIGIALVALVVIFSIAATYASGNILPGVSVAGVNLGGMGEADAVLALREAWSQESLTLRDGERTWQVPPGELGFQIDAVASVQQAMRYGHEQGGLSAMFQAMLNGVDLPPVIEFNYDAARDGLLRYREIVGIPAQNATVQLQGAVVTHIDAQDGRRLDVNHLLPALSVNPAQVMANGVVDLPMITVSAMITDASPLVPYAQALIQHPLRIEAYDPVDDRSYPLEVPPEQWRQWLDTRLVFYDNGPRLYLSVSASSVRAYLEAQARSLPEPLTLDLDGGVRAVQDAVANGSLSTWVPVRYLPTVYTVQRGETAYSISRTTGFPFYLIEQANPDRDLSQLYTGDQINLPSRDIMLPLPPVRGKRIIVDLSDQYLRAYENGQVVYEWPISSGISSAPTSEGIFQILSHEELAYGSSYALCDEDTCGQWVMHWFMGIYEVVPGLVNGFHGAVELPNGRYLGGGQVGRPYTYGCIMSLEENAIALYNWAEDGVIVEIRQ